MIFFGFTVWVKPILDLGGSDLAFFPNILEYVVKEPSTIARELPARVNVNLLHLAIELGRTFSFGAVCLNDPRITTANGIAGLLDRLGDRFCLGFSRLLADARLATRNVEELAGFGSRIPEMPVFLVLLEPAEDLHRVHHSADGSVGNFFLDIELNVPKSDRCRI